MRRNPDQKIDRLIKKVRSQLLTSHMIVDRIEFPYFWRHENIPSELEEFKALLTKYRKTCSDQIAKESETLKFRLPPIGDANDLSKGSFFHGLVLHLLLASYGIGDCGECSTQIALELTKAGYRNFALVGLEFTAAKEGMERHHQFVVVNVPEAPQLPSNESLDFNAFTKCLPSKAIIVDSFLGVSFCPDQVPSILIDYLTAYGKETKLTYCRHFFNCSERFFDSYLGVVNSLRGALVEKKLLPSLNKFSSAERWRVLTLPIQSEGVKEYLTRLHQILGSDGYRSIVTINEKTNTVNFPLHWLGQLKEEAIGELSTEMGMSVDQFHPGK